MAKQDEQIKKALLEALEKTLGVITTACKQVGISRGKYYKLLNEDEDFKASVEEINNVSLDFVESQLFKQIKDGNTTATIFYLKCKGKHRGYVEKQEVEHSGNVNTGGINITVQNEKTKELVNKITGNA